MFNYTNQVKPLDIKVQEVFGRRYYITPEGNRYPSITTLLGAQEKPHLTEWRESLGKEKADEETKRCAARGTAVHAMVEQYLLNNPNPTQGHTTDHIGEFNSLRMKLNTINNIRTQEIPLYSDTLKVAGRVDCIAEYNGQLSVIDFKTSNNTKKHDMIEDYYLQATAYAIMFNELYGEWIDQIVIIMSVERGAGIPLVFKQPTEDYVRPLIKRINTYYKELNGANNG